MQIESATISVKGKRVSVPSVNIDGSTIIVTGKWLKIAMVQDEEWLQNEPVKDPESFTANLRQLPLKADLFTFSQRLGETKPHSNDLHFEPDNAAAIPITTFDQWWESLPQVTRKNVRRAGTARSHRKGRPVQRRVSSRYYSAIQRNTDSPGQTFLALRQGL